MPLAKGAEMLHSSRYFRISLTGECNLACYFCHNEGQQRLHRLASWLDGSDLAWTCTQAKAHGFRKFKLTGGEPTLRPDLLDIIGRLRRAGIDDLSMITNGVTLKKMAAPLRAAGLPRLNVSLYTLDEQRFIRDNRGSGQILRQVIEGIDAAIYAGYRDLKLNYVWHQNRHLSDFLRIADFAAARGLTVAVLPLMVSYGMREGDETVALDDVRRALAPFCVPEETISTDAEGIHRRMMTLRNGARVLLRMEELGRLEPYAACAACPKRVDCREGIFPVRLAANGALRPCLAEGRPPIPLLGVIKRRDALAFEQALLTVHAPYADPGKLVYAGAA